MIPDSYPVLQMSSTVVNVVNVTGIGLILLYGFFHSQCRRASKTTTKEEYQKKSAATMAVFAFYAVLMATWGPNGTWVATIGSAIDSNIQRFATELVLVGQDSRGASSGTQLLGTVKIIGLVTYIFGFMLVSFSNSIAKRVVSTIKSIP